MAIESVESDGVELGTIVAGRYVVLDKLAEGGLSVVYRVEHVNTGERLAMKVLRGRARLDPDAIRRFQQEARTASRLRSEHVVRVTDADTALELGGSFFMVMELLEGADLETFASREGPLAPEVVVRTLAPVASVLGQAHRLGIVHRDVKPENLFLHERADGTTIVKVLDFGISKLTSEGDAEALRVTSTGAVLGTPLYMAPEQAHGKSDEVGPATDVWAMGLVALRLLAGESYWGAPTMAELMTKITALPLVPPSERWPDAKVMTPALDAWFLRSCERDGRRRWSSVDEQLDALAAALGAPRPWSGPDPSAPHPMDAPSELAHAKTEAALVRASAPTQRSRSTLVLIGAAAAAAVVVPWTASRSGVSVPERDPQFVTNPTEGEHPDAATRSDTGTSASAPAAEVETAAPSAPASASAALVASAPNGAGRVPGGPARGSAPVSALSASSKEPPPITCRDGEVVSSGRCCPSGHVWQSGRCARPIATSF